MVDDAINPVVATTQAYYDGPADEIYRSIWGDNVHLGVPCSEECPHPEAMEHTNEIMASAVFLGPGARVLDLGCGYGSTARYLASNFGCSVTGTNISEKELELARERAAESGLGHLLSFEYEDFHNLGYQDATFDVVWSQEAFPSRSRQECRSRGMPPRVETRRDTGFHGYSGSPGYARCGPGENLRQGQVAGYVGPGGLSRRVVPVGPSGLQGRGLVAARCALIRLGAGQASGKQGGPAAPHRGRYHRPHPAVSVVLGRLRQRWLHRLGDVRGG